jgi:hypothetical protein
MTPQERRDMPWIAGAFVVLALVTGAAMLYRLLV